MRTRGFTLIELLVVVAILAIIGSIAVPSFQQAYLSNRLASYANDFVAGVQFARSEAIKRNVKVTMCASSNGTSCTTSATSWQPGWIIKCQAASSTATTCTSGGSSTLVLLAHEALSSSYKVETTAPASNGYTIDFPASGVGITVGSASAATVLICRQSPSAGTQERVINVSASGRTQVTRTTTGSCA